MGFLIFGSLFLLMLMPFAFAIKSSEKTNEWMLIPGFIIFFWISFFFESRYRSVPANEVFILTIKYLWPVFLIAVWLINKRKKENIFVIIFGSAFVIFLGSTGYVMAINANIGTQKIVKIEGKVLYKSRSTGKTVSNQITVNDVHSGQEIIIEVSRGDYNNSTIGESYKLDIYEGSLGIRYVIFD